ncbi:hypothetical protein BHUM_03582 [Candidatus Burkholderia humilis]|nr:hypothetical protein BHUM_03582 [Candidatus Burkholderia humilis]
MFSSRRYAGALAQAIKASAPDVIYIDGIYLVDQLLYIERLAEGRPIIVDFDDLMSRRATALREANMPLSAGYLADFVPASIMKLINARFIRDALLRYEASCLARQEREAVHVA